MLRLGLGTYHIKLAWGRGGGGWGGRMGGVTYRNTWAQYMTTIFKKREYIHSTQTPFWRGQKWQVPGLLEDTGLACFCGESEPRSGTKSAGKFLLLVDRL